MNVVRRSPMRAAAGYSVLLTIASVFATERPAVAGPVAIDAGVIDVHYETPDGADDARFGFTGPGAATRRYTGRPLSEDEPLTGPRGDLGVTYDLRETDDGAVLDADVFSVVNGPFGRSLGGRVDFGVTLVTDRDLRYSLTVDPTVPGQLFRTTFHDVDASLSVSVLGDVSGNLVQDGQPASRTFEGLLPAGTYVLAMEAVAVNGRSNDGGSTAGSALLTLAAGDEGPGPTPIPLPPAVWTGLLTLAGAAGATLFRSRFR